MLVYSTHKKIFEIPYIFFVYYSHCEKHMILGLINKSVYRSSLRMAHCRAETCR